SNGSNSGTINIPTTVDALIEDDETVNGQIANLTGAPAGVTIGTANATGTILDDDGNSPTEGIAVADFTVNEAAGTATFIISYTGNTVQNSFTVDFAVTDDSAINPDDYDVATAGTTVTFPANTASGDTQSVTINIVDDAIIEDAESMNIALSFTTPVPGVNMLDANGVGTITDNDGNSPTEGIAVADFTVNEGVGTVDFVISYTGNTVQNSFTVDFAITDGTALSIGPDLDYSVVSAVGTVTFPANTTSGDTQNVTVTIIDDAIIESDETIDINLSFAITSPGVNMLDPIGLGTITDNDGNSPTEGIAVSDFTVNEDAGTAEFVISYTGNTMVNAVTVNYNIADGTALSVGPNIDYSVVSAVDAVTFPANTASGDTQNITVTINDDVLVEDAETIDINLSFASSVSGVNLLDAVGLGTITDNDANDPTEGVAVSD
ncbi:Calx-beta domain-containing protein, partial [Croceitalea vernalis]